ncbi:MAG: T9SS type A sorting domain-containing protein [Paludibacteraceae bacterium]|nr:T9SS type A sorting domain-containing protein [Paludibacteraceae bacterium]
MKKINLLALMLLISISAAFAKLQPADFTVYGIDAVGTDIAVAASGNVYVASRILASTNTNGLVSPVAYDGYALSKMTHDGQIEWTKFITGNDVNIAYGGKIKCMVDADENVIVAMHVAPGTSNSDLITINDNEQIALSSGSRGCGLLVSYSSNGRTNFSKSYKNIAGGENYSQPFISDIAIDGSGNIFVAGNHYRSFYADQQLIEVHTNTNSVAVQTGFILKYSNEGVLLSNKTFKSGRGISNLIITWDNDNVYCAGKYDFSFFDGEDWHKHPNAPAELNQSTYNQGIFIQKMSNSFTNAETRYLEVTKEGNSSIESPVSDIYISANNNIIITGAKGDDQISYNETEVFPAESGSKKSFIISFDQDFNLDWAHLIGKEGNSQFFVSGNEISGDSDGNIFLTTNARTSVNIGDTILQGGNKYAGVIAKYTEDGDFVHASLLYYGEYDNINAIAFNADKSKMYLTGQSLYWQYQNPFDNIKPRRYDGDIENSATSMFVCRYDDVEYVDPNILALKTQFPAENETDVDKQNPVRLSFNKSVTARTDLSISISTPSTGFQQSIAGSEISVTDTVATFSMANLADGKKHAVIIPQGFFVDATNPDNSWPKDDDYTILFSTKDAQSVIKIDFLNDAKENMVWTTDVANEYYYEGHWDFDIKGIPMRWNTTYSVEESPNYIATSKVKSSQPHEDAIGAVMLVSGNAQLMVNTTGLQNKISKVSSQVYQNCCNLTTNLYGGRKILYSDKMDGCIPDYEQLPTRGDYWYTVQNITNEDLYTIDSIHYTTPEGYVLQMEFEIVDIATPVVNLGDDIKLCRGDSAQIDAGYLAGAEYLWNTNATTQKIWVKEAGEYSVTVKNTLGEASDAINVQVFDTIVTILPDTIYACPGDTVTLNAGSRDYGYFWSVRYPQDTPIRKVTESGLYQVIISNGACAVIDSVRVIYKPGATLNAAFMQGGATGYEDVAGELYKKNNSGRYELFRTDNMPQTIRFEGLPAGEYVLKAHFVDWTFPGENPFVDTYHDQSVKWSDVTPFILTCESDTSINFLLQEKKSDFDFNGTGVISGTVAFIGINPGSNINRAPRVDNCDTRVLLLDGTGAVIASQCVGSDGLYSFSNLPAGNYAIVIERAGFEMTEPMTTALEEGEQVVNVNFTVDESTQTVASGITTAIFKGLISNQTKLFVYPNPAIERLYIAIVTQNGNDAILTVTDLSGREIVNKNILLQAGQNLLKLDNPGLKGMYILHINTKEEHLNSKIVFE